MKKSFYSSDTRVKLALTGLLLRGPVSNLFSVLSLDAAVPVISAIAIGLFVLGLVDLLNKIPRVIIVSTLVIALLWGMTILLFPKNLTYMRDEWVQTFIHCLPFMWLGYYFVKQGIFLEYFLPIARVKLILALLVQIIILVNPAADIWDKDYMTAAKEIIVGLIAVYYLYIRDRKKLDFLLSLVGTIIILTVGSRGGLVAIVFFWGVWWVTNKRNGAGNTIFIILLFLFIVLSGPIMNAIFSLAETFGYSSHIADTIEGGGIFNDEVRKSLFLFFIDNIKAAPFGYGVMGDRALTEIVYFKPIYPHNLYLEILTNFGYMIGGIVSLMLTFSLVKSIMKCDNKQYRMAVITLSSIAFVRLMFSGSYWSEQMFFLLVGILLAAKNVNRVAIIK
jgi:hypothetical protein